jgi:hypothetical protein
MVAARLGHADPSVTLRVYAHVIQELTPAVAATFADAVEAAIQGDPGAISPNNDTLYLIAPLDLSGGPLVLHVPDTHDRYYVLQFVDAWTNNFAYIGRRATGTAEARYLLVPVGYQGEIPAGI